MVVVLTSFEIINNKARHNLIDAKCRGRSDWLNGTAWSNKSDANLSEGDTKPTRGL